MPGHSFPKEYCWDEGHDIHCWWYLYHCSEPEMTLCSSARLSMELSNSYFLHQHIAIKQISRPVMSLRWSWKEISQEKVHRLMLYLMKRCTLSEIPHLQRWVGLPCFCLAETTTANAVPSHFLHWYPCISVWLWQSLWESNICPSLIFFLEWILTCGNIQC